MERVVSLTAKQRREAILAQLEITPGPISATALASMLGVSRQIIVGDIALLRAGGINIASTSRGYLIPTETGMIRQVVCSHSAQQSQEELYAMVDGGCTVLDVIIEHPVYGQLTASLQLSSRYDVDQFMRKMEDSSAQPLSLLTEGIHAHTLSVPSEDAYRHTLDALRQLQILLED